MRRAAGLPEPVGRALRPGPAAVAGRLAGPLGAGTRVRRLTARRAGDLAGGVVGGRPPSERRGGVPVRGRPPATRHSRVLVRGRPPTTRHSGVLVRHAPPATRHSGVLVRHAPPATYGPTIGGCCRARWRSRSAVRRGQARHRRRVAAAGHHRLVGGRSVAGRRSTVALPTTTARLGQFPGPVAGVPAEAGVDACRPGVDRARARRRVGGGRLRRPGTGQPGPGRRAGQVAGPVPVGRVDTAGLRTAGDRRAGNLRHDR
ncbi:hypothetical protein [Micromonospora sp. NPDC126480]|uniref:hypothetical protein n=1 Tax=Micromonospora sp. NPDC126480 TaxID=3155312 RepID=UPI00332F8950